MCAMEVAMAAGMFQGKNLKSLRHGYYDCDFAGRMGLWGSLVILSFTVIIRITNHVVLMIHLSTPVTLPPAMMMWLLQRCSFMK